MPLDDKETRGPAPQTARDVTRAGNHGDFENAGLHESYGEGETSPPYQRQQPEWTDHVDVLSPVPNVSEVDEPARKVTSEKGGAKREGFFRRRDYR
jgi:hypothetical protein